MSESRYNCFWSKSLRGLLRERARASFSSFSISNPSLSSYKRRAAMLSATTCTYRCCNKRNVGTWSMYERFVSSVPSELWAFYSFSPSRFALCSSRMRLSEFLLRNPAAWLTAKRKHCLSRLFHQTGDQKVNPQLVLHTIDGLRYSHQGWLPPILDHSIKMKIKLSTKIIIQRRRKGIEKLTSPGRHTERSAKLSEFCFPLSNTTVDIIGYTKGSFKCDTDSSILCHISSVFIRK